MTTTPDAAALLRLAERVEAATGPDRELDAEIAAAIRGNSDDLPNPSGITGIVGSAEGAYLADLFTASLDAAMMLTNGLRAGPDAIVREAITNLAKRFSLHIDFWPETHNYAEWLARFVTASALRAIAAKEVK